MHKKWNSEARNGVLVSSELLHLILKIYYKFIIPGELKIVDYKGLGQRKSMQSFYANCTFF